MKDKKLENEGVTSFGDMGDAEGLVSVFGDMDLDRFMPPPKVTEQRKAEPKKKDIYNKEETQSAPPAKESKKKVKKPVGRPKLNRETTERRTFTILPSLYNKAMDKARGEGKTLSEVVSALLSEYVGDGDCEDNI